MQNIFIHTSFFLKSGPRSACNRARSYLFNIVDHQKIDGNKDIVGFVTKSMQNIFIHTSFFS